MPSGRLIISSLLLSIIFCPLLAAQCPITVDAGPDQVVCTPGNTVTLNGNITGNYLGAVWSPPTGLSDPNSLITTATVTGPAIYTLTGFATDPSAPNLVVNPAFEGGNVGFSSVFTFTSSPISPGTYFLTTSPSLVLSSFPPCDDHTFGNGTGNMMLINGDGAAGSNVWCQTIAVNPNTYYVMSAWVASSPISPPQLQFTVNGINTGSPFFASGGGCNWEEFSASWFSGPATTATLCIVDQNNSGNGLFGDDFALDDIYFAQACSATDQVMMDVIQVEAVLDPFTTLPCNALPGGITLDGSSSTAGPNITYQWFTPDGNIVAGGNTLMPTIDMEGSYILTVTYDNGITQCTDQATINVFPDPNIVIANATVTGELNCTNPTLTLNGGGSSTGPTISYEWTPAAGVAAGQGTLYPEVNAADIYTLTVANSISGCTATVSIPVAEDFAQPTALASVPGLVTCADSVQTLSGNGSSTGSNFSYQWEVLTWGNIVSGINTLNNAQVDTAGIYSLTVTNTDNGCTASAFVSVGQNTTPPDITTAALGNINCNNPTATVSGTGSGTGSSLAYLWTTPNGNIQSGETTLNAVVDAGGQYILTITNINSQCTAADTTTVLENTNPPVAEITPPAGLTCSVDSLVLDGSESSQGAGFTNEWTTIGGNILSGDTTLSPVVNEAGTYFLVVIDSTNGCADTATAQVAENTNPPIAEAGPPATLDCDNSPVVLSGTGSGQGSDINFLWTTTGGNILTGDTTLSPEINAAGIYFLTVTNEINDCFATDSVTVTQDGNAPTATAMVNDTLDCETAELTIDGSGSSGGAGIQITWSTSGGNIVSGGNTLTPTVNTGGTYLLSLLDQNNNCAASVSVTVVQDTILPIAAIAPPAGLNCTQPTDTLTATGSSQGSLFSPSWLSPDGNILNGDSTLQPEIDTGGTYILTIVNEQNACIVSDTVVVTADFAEPLAAAGASQTLTCAEPTAVLDGTASSQGNEYIYDWTFFPPPGGGTGGIISGGNTLSPEVDENGMYVLLVTDTLNGCSGSDTTVVSLFSDYPQVDIGAADTLTCAMQQQTLQATVSTGSMFSYSWTTPDGNIVSGDSTLSPLIDAPGAYLLTVTNIFNGCTSADVVLVAQDAGLPVAEAGPPTTLSCDANSIVLSGTGSSAGSEYFYSWTTTNGLITAGSNTLMPTINAPGIYVLTVTNSTNGCAASDQVIIDQDASVPVADAGPVMLLTCDSSVVVLDGSSSSSGAGIIYSWSTMDGNILTGANTLTPVADAAGTYLLTVTDVSSNCQSVATTVVMEFTEPPMIQVTDTVELTCADSVLTLYAAATGDPVFSWTTADGNIIGPTSQPVVVTDEPGTYLLTVTNAANGCTATATAVVMENTTPPLADAGEEAVLNCETTQAELNGSSDDPFVDDFFWTFDPVPGTTGDGFLSGQMSPAPWINLPGIYTLTVTDAANGCTATDTVAVVQLLLEAIEIETAGAGCQGSGSISISATTGGTSPYLFSLDGGLTFSTEPVFTDIAPGQYEIVVRDNGGCELSETVEVTGDQGFTLDVEGPPVLLSGESWQFDPQLDILLSDISTISWQPAAGLSCSDCLDPVLTADVISTIYLLTVTGTNGCSATASVAVVVEEPPAAGKLYIPNVFSPNGDGINDVFMLFAQADYVESIETFYVFTRWGESVFFYENFLPNDVAFGWDGSHKGEPLGAGVYGWFAILRLAGGDPLVMKGDITLIR